MPKIVIKEYDKTSAGIGLYSNFTVLVPGFVDLSIWDKTKFDDNGVYEVSSKEDFKKYVGKVAATKGIVKAATAAKITGSVFHYDGEGSDDSDEDGREWILRLIATCPEDSHIYEARENETGEIGELTDVNYVYYPEGGLAAEDITEDYDVEGRTYAYIAKGNEGNDEITGEQYGNQIAYELLGLGYTVLFKKMETISDLSTEEFWSPLKDKSIYDFRFIISGLISGTSIVNNQIRSLAHFVNTAPSTSGRGDCTALCEIDSEVYAGGLSQGEAIEAIKSEAIKFNASEYASLFAPFVRYTMAADEAYENNNKFPASFHYLACAAKAAENYNEWYAVAGYTRGISNYSIESVGCKLGEEAVQALEPRYTANSDTLDKAVNLIIKIKNNYYLWGNRTAKLLGKEGSEDADLKATHFLNVRQLCTTIKKQVYVTCRKYTFDPNSDLLWINFCNDIRPLLEKMKADQGITDYKFVKIKTNQKGILKAKIRIVPIEAVEDFDISLTLEDSITGVATEIEEE